MLVFQRRPDRIRAVQWYPEIYFDYVARTLLNQGPPPKYGYYVYKPEHFAKHFERLAE